MKTIPKKYHALRRIIGQILNKSEVYMTDIDIVKEIMSNHLHAENLSPAEIAKLYNIEYSDFGMFLKKSFGLKLKPTKEAVINYNDKIGRSITDKKQKYQNNCKFNFDPYMYHSIPGYDDLQQKGIYHPTSNPEGVCRDHIISIEYGWRNNIDESLIRHPANCQFISNIDNIRKGNGNGFSIEQLKERIDNWDKGFCDNIIQSYKQLPKTDEHKRKISETNKKYHLITNGLQNRRVLKNEPLPPGWRKGFIRKKLVPEAGLEPARHL